MVTVLAADPPWLFGDNKLPRGRGASSKYKCLPLDRIMSFPLPPVGNNAVLFLWRCASMQLEALQVAIAWGFVPKADLVWQKLTKNGRPHFGMGRYTRGSVETCIIATRGEAFPALRDQRNTFSARLPLGPDGKPWHSAKPDEFYSIVERLYPDAQRFELFARTRRPGWEQLGNQLPKLAPAASSSSTSAPLCSVHRPLGDRDALGELRPLVGLTRAPHSTAAANVG